MTPEALTQSRFDDEALARLHAHARPGHQYTQQEIADACGVSRQRIEQFERLALHKLRESLEQVHRISAKDVL